MASKIGALELIRSTLNRIPSVAIMGKVTRVVGLVIEGDLPHVPVGASCVILQENGEKLAAEVIGLKESKAILMPIGNTAGVRVGDSIQTLSHEVTVKVSEKLLGRVLDGSGAPMDGGPDISDAMEYPLYHPSVSPIHRKMVDKPFSVGIRAIDAFLTCGVGQRVAIMAGSGVGKSTLMGMMARNSDADINVIGLLGERGREVGEFLEDSLGKEGLKKSVVIIATSDSPALLRMRAAFITTTIAEYFRDQGAKVLLMMDSLTRFAMASREVGLSLGEPPTVKGYTPSLFAALPRLLERAGTTEGAGSITGFYTILTEGDDLQDPVADAVRSIVDGHIVLSRELTTMGHYPPIDIIQSLSRVMPQVTTKEHQNHLIQVRRLIALYEEMKDYIRMGVYVPGRNAELDQAIAKREMITHFLQQKRDDQGLMPETLARLQKIALEN
ncbi:MAG: FliI/YscN family ATPase [Deltaproteobacteria bacterium]|nr:MAG: FliI/YscN family ATPase [Deltaproteobacteria bacterium]